MSEEKDEMRVGERDGESETVIKKEKLTGKCAQERRKERWRKGDFRHRWE